VIGKPLNLILGTINALQGSPSRLSQFEERSLLTKVVIQYSEMIIILMKILGNNGARVSFVDELY
jgi:hypothetical protein